MTTRDDALAVVEPRDDGATEDASGVAEPSWHRIALIGMFVVIAIQLVLAGRQMFHSTGAIFQADSFTHLMNSRYTLHDWRFVLGVWARPVVVITYLPAAILGLGVLHAENLAIIAATALLTMGIARTFGFRWWPAAGILLLAQPCFILVADGAIPQVVFSLLLAAALLCRARQHHVAALLVVSLLPLTRAEGLVVLVVWAILEWKKGRTRLVPLLLSGTVVWWVATTVTYGDPLYLLSHNRYLRAVDTFGSAGPGFAFGAATLVFGGVVCGLAIIGLTRRGHPDPMIPALVIVMFFFYATTWTFGLFDTAPYAHYLTTISVPVALLALSGVSDSEHLPWRINWRDLVALLLGFLASYEIVTSAVYPTRHVLLRLPILVVVALLVLRRLSMPYRARCVLLGGLVLTAVVLGVAQEPTISASVIDPLEQLAIVKLKNTDLSNVVIYDPVIALHAKQEVPPLVVPSGVLGAPLGTTVLWESPSDANDGALSTYLQAGYTPLWTIRAGSQKAVLLRRTSRPG